MGIVQVAGVAVLSLAMILVLREVRPSLALPARLAAALVLLSAAILLYLPVLQRVRELLSLSGAQD